MADKQVCGNFGTLIHGTMRPEDLIPAFANELERLAKANNQESEHSELLKDCREINFSDNSTGNLDNINYCLEDLFTALDDFAPDYAYFGANPGDGSDYGFWPIEDWQERMQEDGVEFVSDLSEIESRLICVINDHGNATLYRLDSDGLSEIWAIV